MKILHVATIASPDGVAGGPFRVALNQAAELRRRGHEVHLAAGWLGKGERPGSIEGVPTHLFPVFRLVPPMGLSGMVSVGLVLWLIRKIGYYDIVQFHAGRDLISTGSLAVAWARRRPYVIQTHGMIQPDRRLRTRIMDAIAVRRLLLAARVRLVLTQREMEGLSEVLGGSIRLERLFNGVPAIPDINMIPERSGREILYCARMHKRKRPVAFVDMARELRRRGVSATFSLVGPDEGELPAVLNAIMDGNLQDIVHYEGALSYEAVLTRMMEADVYVLPAFHEPFPMSLLEALSIGLPCVCTDSCDISDVLREAGAALVTDGSVQEMADAVESILIDNRIRSQLSSTARLVARETFSIEAVGGELERFYGIAKQIN